MISVPKLFTTCLLFTSFLSVTEAANISCAVGYDTLVVRHLPYLTNTKCGSNQICLRAEAKLTYTVSFFGSTVDSEKDVILGSCEDASSCASVSCQSVYNRSGLSLSAVSPQVESLSLIASSCNISCCDWKHCNLDSLTRLNMEKKMRANTTSAMPVDMKTNSSEGRSGGGTQPIMNGTMVAPTAKPTTAPIPLPAENDKTSVTPAVTQQATKKDPSMTPVNNATINDVTINNVTISNPMITTTQKAIRTTSGCNGYSSTMEVLFSVCVLAIFGRYL